MIAARLSRLSNATILFVTLTVISNPAIAKSYPKTIKQCSHVATSVTVTGPEVLINQLKQHAMSNWENQTGADVNIATQKQFSCVTSAPKTLTCTFSARACFIKKIIYPTLQPPKSAPRFKGQFEPITPGGGNSFSFTPRNSSGGSSSGGGSLRRR